MCSEFHVNYLYDELDFCSTTQSSQTCTLHKQSEQSRKYKIIEKNNQEMFTVWVIWNSKEII